jgi:hypothetical protein
MSHAKTRISCTSPKAGRIPTGETMHSVDVAMVMGHNKLAGFNR